MRRILANVLAGRQSYASLRSRAIGALLLDRVGLRPAVAVLRSCSSAATGAASAAPFPPARRGVS